MSITDETAERRSLSERITAIDWYHTLVLAPGLVTPGWLDHRGILARVPLPASLDGKRCLDVGTFNGYWAFEMERRGASEVVAIDVLDPRAWDWPVVSKQEDINSLAQRMAGGDGFEIAREALGSRVDRRNTSVYDVGEADFGTFDLVYVGSLLVHLRDPVRALERIRSVCRGSLIVVDGIDLPLSLRCPRLPVARLDGRGRPWWWYANLAGLGRLVEAAGFELTETPGRLFVPTGDGWRPNRFSAGGMLTREGRYQLTAAWLGDPHGVIVARPAA